jgi:hypothetical protein
VCDDERYGILDRLRVSIKRGRPYAADDWISRTVADLGLEHTVRPEGQLRAVHRGRVGVCLPGRHHHGAALWPFDRPAGGLRLLSGRQPRAHLAIGRSLANPGAPLTLLAAEGALIQHDTPFPSLFLPDQDTPIIIRE